MTPLIHGRVTDSEGRPIAQARVFLRYSFESEPALGTTPAAEESEASVTVTNEAGEYGFSIEEHPGLAEMLQEHEERALLFKGKHQHALCLRAIHEEWTCRKLVLDWDGRQVQAPDLVLEPGVVGQVVATWADGAPAAGVKLDVTVSDRQPPSEDPRDSIHSFRGVTDERGELAFGPILDLKYRITVDASHPGAPPHTEWWDSRVPRRGPLELTMPGGRTVCGRLMTANGQPAVGFRVAPWEPRSGDPEPSRVVTTDASGRFAVAGVGRQAGAGIAVYDKLPALPSPSDDPEALARLSEDEYLARLSEGIGRPLNPLLIQEVAVGRDDLGTVGLPRLGTFTVRLQDPGGNPPRSGHVMWTRPDKSHGSRGHHIDAEGVVRLRRMPLGIAVNLDVTIEDSQHGELQQRFGIAEVKEETVALRVTGAGTVVIRLHAADSPQEPLVARFINVHWHECSGGWEDGPTSELRWWVPPGRYRLTIKAKGFRERILKKIHVRDDGPTFLDVELKRR